MNIIIEEATSNISHKISNYECAMTGQHKEVNICECGESKMCYACGYGYGQYPCSCRKQYLEELTSEWRMGD